MHKVSPAVSPAVLVAVVLTLAAVILALIGGIQSMKEPLTPIEAAYSHGLALLLGIAGSFWGGSLSTKNAAKEIVRPTARSGFRRVRSIYMGLSRIAQDVESLKLADSENHTNLIAVGRIQSTVEAFLVTADDAMEEWRDIVPEDVKELYEDIEHHKSNVSREPAESLDD